MVVLKVALGSDIRRFRPAQPLHSIADLQALVREVFALQPYPPVELLQVTPEGLVLLDALSFARALHSAAPDALISLQVRVPPSFYPPLVAEPLASPHHQVYQPQPPPVPQPHSCASSRPASQKPPQQPPSIPVPHKYRQIVWSLQDEFREATEWRALTLLIRLACNVPLVREEMRTLSRGQLLLKDVGRRGRPKKMPPPPLYFPKAFQSKVRTLMEAGFPADLVVDALMANGGSAQQASLALIGAAPDPAHPDAAYHQHRRAVEASVADPHDARFGPEPLDRVITLDQRVVDSLLLLERTQGFDRQQIIKAAESLSTSASAQSPARSRVLQSIPAHMSSALALLSGMGFHDAMLNLFLLERHKGNIAAVIDELSGR
ncbi:MAG: hypothetical protein Q8P67_04695 [archaeon]|nr:hypothetical protein [archaeon]